MAIAYYFDGTVSSGLAIGDRVRLKSLHHPVGTVVEMEDGTMLGDVVLVAPRYKIQWDDGETGSVSGNDVEVYDGGETTKANVGEDSGGESGEEATK